MLKAERERLGENHPLFLTQYRLLPIQGGGGFFKASSSGNNYRETHPRLRKRRIRASFT